MAAVGTGQEEVVDLLLHHPDVDLQAKDDQGWSALHWACFYGQEGLVTRLVEAVGEEGLAVRDRYGETPVLLALANGRGEGRGPGVGAGEWRRRNIKVSMEERKHEVLQGTLDNQKPAEQGWGLTILRGLQTTSKLDKEHNSSEERISGGNYKENIKIELTENLDKTLADLPDQETVYYWPHLSEVGPAGDVLPPVLDEVFWSDEEEDEEFWSDDEEFWSDDEDEEKSRPSVNNQKNIIARNKEEHYRRGYMVSGA